MPIDHPDFRRAMMEAGLVPPTELVDDGRIHRCGIEGKKRSNRSGAYSITPDGRFGGYQNWASGSEWQSWRAAMPSQLTPAQREAILEVGRQATAKRLADEKLWREAARLKAIEMWGKATRERTRISTARAFAQTARGCSASCCWFHCATGPGTCTRCRRFNPTARSCF